MARMTAAVCIIAAAAAAQVGWLDTIGGTTYDWQGQGPVHRMYCNAPPYGRHALWMYSASTSGTVFPDRNMRYNFRDETTGDWNWIDPDFMASGVNVYGERSGFGNLGVDPQTGVAVTCAHQGSPLHPALARDMASGAGIFEFCPGPDGYQWPVLAVGGNGW
ncbi:hypothetical protein FJY71_03860, partial [candidate division WOR-3 bacterium]|nr:hypothetical protein [candidate division WOR-3 bacterium]